MMTTKALAFCAAALLTTLSVGELSKPVMPKSQDYYGFSCVKGDNDVHVYVMRPFGVVIGTNVSMKDEINFSDMALSVDPDGKVSFQYADDKGRCNIVDLTPEQWRGAVLRMLRDVKRRAEGE